MRYIGSLLIVVFITACGYKPTVHYSREVLGERIHVDVSISRKDPKNSVLIKDAVNESVITRVNFLLKLAQYLFLLFFTINMVMLPLIKQKCL